MARALLKSEVEFEIAKAVFEKLAEHREGWDFDLLIAITRGLYEKFLTRDDWEYEKFGEFVEANWARISIVRPEVRWEVKVH